VERRKHYWNGKWGRLARRDILVFEDGGAWLVEAREGGAERVLIAFVHGRSAPRTSCRAACAARSFPSAWDNVAPTVPLRIANAFAISS